MMSVGWAVGHMSDAGVPHFSSCFTPLIVGKLIVNQLTITVPRCFSGCLLMRALALLQEPQSGTAAAAVGCRPCHEG